MTSANQQLERTALELQIGDKEVVRVLSTVLFSFTNTPHTQLTVTDYVNN